MILSYLSLSGISVAKLSLCSHSLKFISHCFEGIDDDDDDDDNDDDDDDDADDENF
jgi:hypothetical protein